MTINQCMEFVVNIINFLKLKRREELSVLKQEMNSADVSISNDKPNL